MRVWDIRESPPQPQSLFSLLKSAVRKRLLSRIVGEDADHVVAVGRFRLSGEVHQWMYDRYSLSRIMLETGFCEPLPQQAAESRVPNWSSFNLDTLPDGSVRKPDSLFMEAVKNPGPLGPMDCA